MAASGVGVLDKTMAVLGLLERQSSATPRVVASELGMSPPTAYRLMKAMVEHGLLAVDGSGTYQLGLRLLHLGHTVSSRLDIVQMARPYLVELRDVTKESVELQVRSGFRRIPVHVEAGTRSVRTASEVGVALPLHRGSSSRPLLLALSEDDALALARRSAEADHELEAFDEADYLARWRLARERGYDVGVGERDPEKGAAAAAIRGYGGAVVAQIVVSGTAQRFGDRDHKDMVIHHLVGAARALHRDLVGSNGTERD